MRPPGRPPKSSAPTAGSDRLVEIGRIVNRHGVRGELRMLPHNPSSSAATWLTSVMLVDGDSRELRKVVAARAHRRFILLRLEGVNDANDADALIGSAVVVGAKELPELSPGEAYHRDLIGCAVSTEAGEELGTVQEIITTASNDVCVVTGRGREYLIPLIEDAIARLDIQAQRIVVRPLPGLLDP